MRPRGCLNWGMRCFAAALAFLTAATAPVQAETITLNYELSAAGIGVADVVVTTSFEGPSYRITAAGHSYGLASVFGDLTLSAMAEGAVAGGFLTPRYFGTHNLYDGETRITRVGWPGGVATVEEVVPSAEQEERSPVPETARQSAVDPISAMLAFAIGSPASGLCTGRIDVYDGRRSYTLMLDGGPDGAQLEAMTIGDVEVTTRKCRVTSIRTGGKSPEGVFSSGKDRESAEIWFWTDAAGRAVPVRVEADAPIGTAVAQLAALP